MNILRSALAAIVAAGLAGGVGTLEAKELKASVHLPPKNNTVADGWVPFEKRVEEGTAGELEIRVFLGGSLLGPKAASAGIRDGVVDLGYVITGYHPAEFPHTALIGDMAAIGSDPVVVTAATTELVFMQCQPCLAEYKAHGNVYTGTYAVPPMVLMSREMLNDPADLSGKKVRSAGGVWDRFAKSLGAVPVNVPSSEQYEAMSRGVIDATLHVASSLVTYDLADLVADVVPVRVGTYRAINTFAFNPDSWAALTTEQRRVVLEAASDSNFDIAHGYKVTGAEAFQKSEAAGVRIQALTPAWQKAVDDFVVSEKSSLVTVGKEKRGVAETEAYIAKMSKLVAKWEAVYRELDEDIEAMKVRFKQDVVAKIDPATYGL